MADRHKTSSECTAERLTATPTVICAMIILICATISVNNCECVLRACEIGKSIDLFTLSVVVNIVVFLCLHSLIHSYIFMDIISPYFYLFI